MQPTKSQIEYGYGPKRWQDANLQGVAAEAGVSPVTVARAFAGNAPVAERTRNKVFAAARKLNYRPNLLARGLRGGATQTVGVLWAMCGPHPSVAMAQELAIRVQQQGYVPYVADNQVCRDVLLKVLDDYQRRSVDGVLLLWEEEIDDEISSLLHTFRACVLVCSQPQDNDLDQVLWDRSAAMEQIADHIAESGRRRPAFVASLAGNVKKSRPLKRRLARHGIELSAERMIDIGDKSDRALGKRCYAALKSYFSQNGPDFDALVCGTDEMAFAAMAWLASEQLRVPEDVAVIGFNDNESSQFAQPPLASVDRRNMELAEHAVAMLFSRLQDKNLPVRREIVHMQFVPRASAG